MTRTFTTYDELVAAVGEHLGHSSWLLVDQPRIDLFAEATGDDQWIHVDAERAMSGPFATTIAHGYLSLSLLPVLTRSLVDYAGWAVKVNYGSNKVRFPMPVRVGSRVRAGVEVVAVTPVPTGIQVITSVTMQIQHDGRMVDKPALIAEVVTLLV
ncbi:MAG: MaoC family dehydratase [Propionibacteriales bacterium]|nr:MaoC family dehydratase [Propionibacteriales bacterium]